jgi:hypothetical protein
MAKLVLPAIVLFVTSLVELGADRGIRSGIVTLAVFAFFVSCASRVRLPLGVASIIVACLWVSLFAPHTFIALVLTGSAGVILLHALDTKLSHPDYLAASAAKVLGVSLAVSFAFLFVVTVPGAWFPWIVRSTGVALGMTVLFHFLTRFYAQLFRPQAIARNSS